MQEMRDAAINVRCNLVEKKALIELAKLHHRTMSEYMRELVRREAEAQGILSPDIAQHPDQGE